MTYDLERFLQAQKNTYDTALKEVKNGSKYSCWMWYVFPILQGLGNSTTARIYGLSGVEEAQEYISHPILGKRLIEISAALLQLEGLTAKDIFGSTDAWKLHCCMTLFHTVAPDNDVFYLVLWQYYGGHLEQRTQRLLGTDFR